MVLARLLIIAGVGVIGWLLSHVTTVLIPVLLAALAAGPVYRVRWLRSKGIPAALAAITVELGLILLVLGLLTLAGQQIIVGFAQAPMAWWRASSSSWACSEDKPPEHPPADAINQWFSELGSTLRVQLGHDPLRRL